jgi:copper resistance protein D
VITAPDVVALALRAAAFVTALQAAGVPLCLWLFGDELQGSAVAARKLGRASALAAIGAAVAYQLFEPARMAGAFGGVADRSLQAMLLASDVGTAAAVRLLGLALIAAGVVAGLRSRVLLAVVGSTLVAVSFVFTGHTVTHDPRWLLVTLLIAHLLIVAFWFGALLPLYGAARRESIEANAVLIGRFSSIAIWLVPGIFFAGLGLAVVLLPGLASLGTPYGVLVLGKVAGFALLMGLAAINKWRLGHAIRSGSARALALFGRSVLVEWVLIATVVTLTSTMTGLFSPGD